MRFYLIILITVINFNTYGKTIIDTLTFHTKMTYKVTFIGDSSNLSNQVSEDCVLFLNDTISLFESSKNHFTKDGKKIERTESGFMYMSWSIINSDNEILTFDWTTNQIADLSKNRYGYKESISDLVWELSDDTATIQNLRCQKATVQFGNRNWIAWFTTDIPISNGPYKFKGLPGLIVNIEDDKKHWNFELVELEKGNYQIPMFAIEKVEWTNKFDFFKLKKHVNNNYLSLKEATSTFGLDNENRAIFKKRIEANIKAISNWIELYP